MVQTMKAEAQPARALYPRRSQPLRAGQMRLQRCKKLIGQLTCGRVEQSPTNLAQFAPDRCMHRIGHTGLATLFDQFDLGTAGSHSGGATRALETHQTAFRRNHLGERERAIEPSPNRSKLDHHPRAPNGVRLVNDLSLIHI